MKFGDVLRELLDEYDISQKEVARELNLAVSTFGNYVRNVREPDYETLKSIAKYFNVSTDYLLDFRKDSNRTHDEERLLQIFHSLPAKEKKLYLEQGALLMKYRHKYEK